jgi:hypothetical protein
MTTTSVSSLSVISSLVLVRLLTVGDKGETVAKIRRDLAPLLVHRWEGAALAEQLERALDELESTALIVLVPGRGKKSAPRFLSTATGKQWGLEFLGVGQLRPKITWRVLKRIYLPARALGVPASSDTVFKALSSDPAFHAMLLKQQFTLSTSDIPKLGEATDALAWKLIGFENQPGKFNIKNVKTLIFNRTLGNGHTTDFKKAVTQLLALHLGAKRHNSNELRDAVLRNWIREHSQGSKVSTSVASLPLRELDLQSFAERVKTAARACSTGRFGENKVFIAHVWRVLQSDPEFRTMDFPAFKQRLTEANNARQLDLSRADLVQAMDPDEVLKSEVRYLNATFHFIRI